MAKEISKQDFLEIIANEPGNDPMQTYTNAADKCFQRAQQMCAERDEKMRRLKSYHKLMGNVDKGIFEAEKEELKNEIAHLKSTKSDAVDWDEVWNKYSVYLIASNEQKRFIDWLKFNYPAPVKSDAVEFVQWANKNGWYKHYDPRDDCWTNPVTTKTATSKNRLYTFIFTYGIMTTLKVLGQVAPGAGADVKLYAVPASTTTVVSSIVVANRTGVATTFRISVRVAAAGDTVAQYLYYDHAIGGNVTVEVKLGISLGALDEIFVRATLATLSFNAFGQENSA